jgi:hypothetical protein
VVYRSRMMRRLKMTSVLILLGLGCGSSSNNSPVGGAITDQPADTHCNGVTPQVVGLCTCEIPTKTDAGTTANVAKTESVAMCIADSNAAVSTGGGYSTALRSAPLVAVAADSADASTDAAGTTTTDYGPTMYGSSGDDDDCKYSVSWTSTPIRENTDVTFTVTINELASTPPNAPATGGDVILEVFLTNIHPGDTTRVTSKETSPGVYQVGPARFDAPGPATSPWTVRFHFNELCADDSDDSPHGHAAFFVQVP